MRLFIHDDARLSPSLSRGEVAIRITLWAAKRLLQRQSSNVSIFCGRPTGPSPPADWLTQPVAMTQVALTAERKRSQSMLSGRSAKVAEEAAPLKLGSSPHLKRAHDHVTASEYNALRKRCDMLKTQLAEVCFLLKRRDCDTEETLAHRLSCAFGLGYFFFPPHFNSFKPYFFFTLQSNYDLVFSLHMSNE